MNARRCDIVGPDEFVFIVYENMVLVSVVIDKVLFCPAGINILLRDLFRILFEFLRYLAGFELVFSPVY